MLPPGTAARGRRALGAAFAVSCALDAASTSKDKWSAAPVNTQHVLQCAVPHTHSAGIEAASLVVVVE